MLVSEEAWIEWLVKIYLEFSGDMGGDNRDRIGHIVKSHIRTYVAF
jgi:hypothetical protein